MDARASTTPTHDGAYPAMTEGCALARRLSQGVVRVEGAEAGAFLQGQLTNDIEHLASGQGCYAALLTHKGKMLADMRVLASGGAMLIVGERSRLPVVLSRIQRYKIGFDVAATDQSDALTVLSLIGPACDRFVEPVDVAADEHANATCEIAGNSVTAARTDVGVDLICPAAATNEIVGWAEAHDVVVIDEQAAEVLRVERGRPRFGFELDETVIPEEAGLNARAVNFEKGCYVGQETVARLHYKGRPNRRLRRIHATAPIQTGDEIFDEQKGAVGTVATAVVSPRYGPIALALVRREVQVGGRITIGASRIPGTARDTDDPLDAPSPA